MVKNQLQNIILFQKLVKFELFSNSNEHGIIFIWKIFADFGYTIRNEKRKHWKSFMKFSKIRVWSLNFKPNFVCENCLKCHRAHSKGCGRKIVNFTPFLCSWSDVMMNTHSTFLICVCGWAAIIIEATTDFLLIWAHSILNEAV